MMEFKTTDGYLNINVVSTGGAYDDEDDSQAYGPFLTGLRTSYILVNILLVILGNSLSIVALRSINSPRFPPSTKTFLYFVILSDLSLGLISILSVPPAILNRWPYGRFLCQYSNFMLTWICSCCVNAAILITFDRLIAVTRPLRHPNFVSKKCAVLTIIVVSSIGLSLTIAIHGISPSVRYNNDAIMCLAKWSQGTSEYLWRLVILGSFTVAVPVPFLLGAYTKLYFAARDHVKHQAQLRGPRRPNAAVHLANRRALTMCALITGTFCMAWMPYVVVSTRNWITRTEAPPWLDFASNWLCICNSWCDVIIYFAMNRELRRTLGKVMSW